MTIEEAIAHCKEVAQKQKEQSEIGHPYEGEDCNIKYRKDCAECSKDHEQLARWLTELLECKQLLKLTFKDINLTANYSVCSTCLHFCPDSKTSTCKLDKNGYKNKYTCRYMWRYQPELVNLLGGLIDESGID